MTGRDASLDAMFRCLEVSSSSSLQDPPSPPSAPPSPPSAPPDPCSALPNNVAAIILHKAGPHTRLVCRTYRALYPPILSLTLHGLDYPPQLEAALATLPPTLTSLDLRLLPSREVNHPVSPANLAAIAATLPRLQQLLLPSIPSSYNPAIVQTLQACPHLHTLTFPSNACGPCPAPQPPCWAPLTHPAVSTRLRSLTLPLRALPHLTPAPPASLPHLTRLRLPFNITPVHPDHLAHLFTIAPSLCSLDIDLRGANDPHLQLPVHLAALTALTHLQYAHSNNGRDTPTGTLLQMVGCVTTLRSLTLNVAHGGWCPAEAGWLSRLVLLTSLDMDLTIMGNTVELFLPATAVRTVAPVAMEIAAATASLPALRTFRFKLQGYQSPDVLDRWLGCGQRGSFFRQLAAATQLRDLTLGNLPLLRAEASLLSRLQGLKALRLLQCVQVEEAQFHAPGPSVLTWVAALRNLRLFVGHSNSVSSMLPDDVSRVVRQQPPWLKQDMLPCLHTLAVDLGAHSKAVPAPLAALLVVLGARLERLQLGGDGGRAAWRHGRPQLLGCMSRLRVLDVSRLRCYQEELVEVLHRILGLPRSLRVCYVPEVLEGGGALRWLRAAHPLVVFRAHARLDAEEW